MSENNKISLEIADLCRASALVAHFGRDDAEGVHAVLQETVDARRTTQLLLAVLDLYNQIVPELRTPLGMSLMSSHILRLAGLEEVEQ